MRITCPGCGSAYEVPDRAVPDPGRDVQCAACGESWFLLKGGVPAPGRGPRPAAGPHRAVGPGTGAGMGARMAAGPSDAAGTGFGAGFGTGFGAGSEAGAGRADTAAAADPDGPPAPPAPDAETRPPVRRVDPDVLNILREEAATERRARAAALRRAGPVGAESDRPRPVAAESGAAESGAAGPGGAGPGAVGIGPEQSGPVPPRADGSEPGAARSEAIRAGSDSTGPDGAGPDKAGPDKAGPDKAGPDGARRARTAPAAAAAGPDPGPAGRFDRAGPVPLLPDDAPMGGLPGLPDAGGRLARLTAAERRAGGHGSGGGGAWGGPDDDTDHGLVEDPNAAGRGPRPPLLGTLPPAQSTHGRGTDAAGPPGLPMAVLSQDHGALIRLRHRRRGFRVGFAATAGLCCAGIALYLIALRPETRLPGPVVDAVLLHGGQVRAALLDWLQRVVVPVLS